jgi:predicted DNA-binding antitoxin AbrB/MazE fold protein
MVSVRAVYHQGQLRLLDPVNLKDGQQVHLQILADEEISLKDLIGDMLVPFERDAEEIDEEALLHELDQQLAGKRPLSEIILEDR